MANDSSSAELGIPASVQAFRQESGISPSVKQVTEFGAINTNQQPEDSLKTKSYTNPHGYPEGYPWRELDQQGLIPESVKEVTNPVDLLGGGDQKAKEAAALKQRQEAEAAHMLRGGERFENQLRNSDKTEVIVDVVRKRLEQENDSNTTETLSNPWGIKTLGEFIFQKEQAMKEPMENLKKRGLIQDYDPSTGKATVIDRSAGDYAMKVDEIPEWVVVEKQLDPATSHEIEIKRLGVRYEYKFGTPAERQQHAEDLHKIYLEIGNNTIIGPILGIQKRYRDDLTNLTEAELQTSHFTVEQIEALFNRIGFSHDDEVALWWYEAMMHSEFGSDLESFIKMPATKELIKRGETEEERTRFLKTMLGDWDELKKNDATRTPKTLEEEVKKHLRGPITEWGKIPARGRGEKNNFDYKAEVNGFIEGTIGRLTNPNSAWYAWAVLQSFEEFSIMGTVEFPYIKELINKGDPNVDPTDWVRAELGTDIKLKANDMSKYDPEFEIKEWAKGRSYGLEGLVGKIPRIAVSYLDHAQIRIGYDGKGDPITLPLRIAWLGENAHKVLDRTTGKMVNVNAVPYTALGKVDFRTLPAGDYDAFTLLHALPARDGWTFDMITNTDIKADDMLETAKHKVKKRTAINMNPVIALLGYFRGQSNPGKAAALAAQEMADKIIKARKKTVTYLLEVRPKNVQIYDDAQPDGRNFVSLEGIGNTLDKKLGLRVGSEFYPRGQSLTEEELKKIPKKGGLAGIWGTIATFFSNLR